MILNLFKKKKKMFKFLILGLFYNLGERIKLIEKQKKN